MTVKPPLTTRSKLAQVLPMIFVIVLAGLAALEVLPMGHRGRQPI